MENALKQHHTFRSAFEERVSVYFSGKMSEKEVSNIVFAPRTLRSRTSAGKRSGSQSSSVLKAKLVAKEELAKLKLKHLKQKQHVEREMQEEMNRQQEEMNKQIELMKEQMKKAEEKRFSLVLLQARQVLEEVSLERQVIKKWNAEAIYSQRRKTRNFSRTKLSGICKILISQPLRIRLD